MFIEYKNGEKHAGAGADTSETMDAFQDCGMKKVWIGYYEGNDKSRRVQEKCGFRFQWKSEQVDVPLMGEQRTGYVSVMTKEDWLKREAGE